MITVKIDHDRLKEMRERESFFRAAAERANAIACDLISRREGYGDRKAYISDVAEQIGIPMKQFAPMVVHWNNLGWVALTRADLPDEMVAGKVRDSAISVLGTHFHLIECRPTMKKNPTVADVDLAEVDEMRADEAYYRPASVKVNDAAKALLRRGAGFGEYKAFISDVAQEVGMPVRRLAPLLLNWNNLGWIQLARADLVGAMDPTKVAASEIKTRNGAQFHFIDTYEYQTSTRPRRNPGRPPPSLVKPRTIEQFVKFHDFEPREVGVIPNLRMPTTARLAGTAIHVMYRSDKWHEGRTDDYIHEHDAGVKVYRTDRECDGPQKPVLAAVQSCKELVRIGRCLGVAYDDGENEVEMKTDSSVQLYYIPSGKALVVVDGVRVRNGHAQFERPKVVMLIWGGRLNVEARGIVH